MSLQPVLRAAFGHMPGVGNVSRFPDGSQRGLASPALAIRHIQTLFGVVEAPRGLAPLWGPAEPVPPPGALRGGLGQGGGPQVAVDQTNKTKCYLFNIK